MMELPEAVNMASQITKTLRGKRVALLKKEAYMGGTVYYCPECQGL